MSTSGSAYPDLLAPVTLRLGLANGASAEVPTRVSDIEDQGGVARVVVSRPDLSGLVDAGSYPHEREDLTLLWALPSGQMQLRVAAEAGSRPYGSVWVLTPAGAPTKEQRRQYFRVPLTLPAKLTPVVDGERTHGAEVRATLVEISEGGAMICSPADLPEIGAIVELSFTLHDTVVTVDGEVLRHDLLPTGRPSAALRFLDPGAYGDRIRRFAFEVQRTRARTPLR